MSADFTLEIDFENSLINSTENLSINNIVQLSPHDSQITDMLSTKCPN